MIEITRKVAALDHFNIRGPERLVEELREFYSKLFGLTPGPRPTLSKPGYWLYAGDHPLVHLTILTDESHEAKPTGRLGHIAFACTDITEAKRRLQAMNVAYKEDVIPALQQVQLFVVDPAGIRIELNFCNS